jgi:AcrR family transcriptional regulator
MSSATPASDSGLPGSGQPPEPERLRADALRNREAVVAAARQVFAEAGLDAPLEEIARRAGVGIATLYRRFPSRLDLVDAILTSAVEAHVRVAEEALAMADPWEGFVHFLTEGLGLQATDRGLNDMMSMRLPRATQAEAAKRRYFEAQTEIISRAQRSGQLRADVTAEDVALLVWATTRIVEATHDVAVDAWRRHLALLLDGFRADRARPLPVPPLTPRQVYRAMLSLGTRCTGSPRPPTPEEAS